MGTDGLRWVLALGLALLSLSARPAAALITNQPVAGETLHILCEGAGNATAHVRLPNGTRLEISLEDGQASLNASMPGRWTVSVQNESAPVLVREGPGPLPPDGRPDAGTDEPLFFLLGAALLLIFLALLALVALAVHAALFAPAQKGARLTKSRRGEEVTVCLQAGGAPLERVELADSVGPGWDGKPMKLKAGRLGEGQRLTMKYAYAGELGEARASFRRDGAECSLECKEGEAREAAADGWAAPGPDGGEGGRAKAGRAPGAAGGREPVAAGGPGGPDRAHDGAEDSDRFGPPGGAGRTDAPGRAAAKPTRRLRKS